MRTNINFNFGTYWFLIWLLVPPLVAGLATREWLAVGLTTFLTVVLVLASFAAHITSIEPDDDPPRGT